MLRKQIEDAVKAVTGIVEDTRITDVPVRLDKDGIHYGAATARPADWTFNGTAHAKAKDLAKLIRQSGKPGSPVEPLEVDGRVKIGTVTLAELGNHDLTGGCQPVEDGFLYEMKALEAIRKGASTDDMRPVLTCVHFDPEAVVATDSYKLFIDESQGQPGMVEDGFNVPAWILKAAASRKGEMLTFKPGPARDMARITFDTAEGCEVSADIRLTAGTFPKYGQLIPAGYGTSCEVAGAVDPVKKVQSWLDKNQPGVLTFNRDAVTVSTSSRSETTVDPVGIARRVQCVEDMRIGFNPDFFLESLDFMDAEHARLEAISPLRPMRFTHGTRTALLMPIKLSD